MYKNEITLLQSLVNEAIELAFYEKRNNGENLFKVTHIDGEEIVSNDVILMGLKTGNGPLMVGAPTNGVYKKLDHTNYIGKLEIYHCKKKKGMFGKESLKTVNSFSQTYHHSGLESGEEVPISIKKILNK